MNGVKTYVTLPSGRQVLVKVAIYELGNGEKACVSLSGLAALSGKSVITLREWEKLGFLPPANFRAPSSRRGQAGDRLYTLDCAKKMAEVISQSVSGVPITADLTRQLYIFMKEEISPLLKK